MPQHYPSQSHGPSLGDFPSPEWAPSLSILTENIGYSILNTNLDIVDNVDVFHSWWKKHYSPLPLEALPQSTIGPGLGMTPSISRDDIEQRMSQGSSLRPHGGVRQWSAFAYTRLSCPRLPCVTTFHYAPKLIKAPTSLEESQSRNPKDLGANLGIMAKLLVLLVQSS